MKIQANLVLEWEVLDLAHYDNAKTVEEAAALTAKQLNDGDLSVYDLIDFSEVVGCTVVAIPEENKKQ